MGAAEQRLSLLQGHPEDADDGSATRPTMNKNTEGRRKIQACADGHRSVDGCLQVSSSLLACYS